MAGVSFPATMNLNSLFNRKRSAVEGLVALAASLSLLVLAICLIQNRPPPYYDIRHYGARGNGVSSDTAAIQAAVDAAATAGGGTVFLPAGTYRSGTIHLRSRVMLRLADGAVLLASRNDSDFDSYEMPPAASISYGPVTWSARGIVDHPIAALFRPALLRRTIDDPDTTYTHYSLLSGDGVTDVAIDGAGAIDGHRSERGGPKLIALKNCRHVAIRDITLRNSSNYNISLVGSRDVDIDNVRILNGYADGIDPDDSSDVRISNCYIDTFDDAICAKASLALGRRLATNNLTVDNCILRTSCNGFKFGTESEGDLHAVTMCHCVIMNRSRGRAPIAGISITSVDGGTVDGVTISGVVMRGVRTPIFLRLGERGRGMALRRPGAMRNITIDRVIAMDSARPSSISGLPGSPICDVALRNIDVSEPGGGSFVQIQVPELPADYPGGEMFGPLPTHSLYARHVDELAITNWRERCNKPDQRPALWFDDVARLKITGLHTNTVAGPEPVMMLRDVRGALIDGVPVRPPASVAIKAGGGHRVSVSDVEHLRPPDQGVHPAVRNLRGPARMSSPT